MDLNANSGAVKLGEMKPWGPRGCVNRQWEAVLVLAEGQTRIANLYAPDMSDWEVKK